MIEWPHRLQGSVERGGRSPGMKTLASHPGQVTIFKGFSLLLMACSSSASGDGAQSPKRPGAQSSPETCYLCTLFLVGRQSRKERQHVAVERRNCRLDRR